MALHIIKLCVGVDDIAEMYQWVKDAKAGCEDLGHTTRMFPRRQEEILPGGSLYWVIRGAIMCRQPIADLVSVRGKDGIERCRIAFKPQIIPVRPTPRRAIQGWRYLEADDAPPDLTKKAIKEAIPPKMRRELAELGLL